MHLTVHRPPLDPPHPTSICCSCWSCCSCCSCCSFCSFCVFCSFCCCWCSCRSCDCCSCPRCCGCFQIAVSANTNYYTSQFPIFHRIFFHTSPVKSHGLISNHISDYSQFLHSPLILLFKNFIQFHITFLINIHFLRRILWNCISPYQGNILQVIILSLSFEVSQTIQNHFSSSQARVTSQKSLTFVAFPTHTIFNLNLIHSIFTSWNNVVQFLASWVRLTLVRQIANIAWMSFDLQEHKIHNNASLVMEHSI